MRILCVGSERRRLYLAKALEESNHSVVALDVLEDALWLARNEYIDAIIALTNEDAEHVARVFAARPAHTVLVIIEARATTQTRIKLLESGADICLDDPYDYAELHARLLAITRCENEITQADAQGKATRKTLLSPSKRSLLCSDGSTLLLRRSEYLLMDRLLRNPGETVRHSELVDYVFGELEVDPTSLHRLVSRLRERFSSASAPVSVTVVPRVGYRAEILNYL
ncbi:response regulator transcription factor [Paraburkholderia sp. Ac-20340]|uniref:response regulator transcription factor n=1 Tax=Paraburkholderia sp. Ac-20340 TaxID=2703888 RepID=UPI0019825B9C|nr:winged helix-turn-helix domain-containing protein [Paraburkholderia sp. Ac-20340]MBN3853451.1 response regulator transcription factor [Paraburkholderia sp. Ac-20340]